MEINDLTFLVVEDDDFQRRALVKMLERVPARCVHAAANGKLALDLLQNMNQPVDIVISDLRMPVMDGMQLIRHIGEKGYRMSVLITSVLERSLLTTVEQMTRAYGIQLLGAIEKPLTLRALRTLIGKHTPPELKPQQHLVAPVFTIDEILEGLKNKEFDAHFQPKVEIASGEIVGVEALARWRHPQQGVVAPDAFIKTLEDHGEIDQLLWLMLMKATQFCTACREAGDDITVALNLSLQSLGDVLLADRITEVVTSLNVQPQQIVLEVTESTAMSGDGVELENLSRLRMKGFGLSIDDYGTGYSSMQQLTRIPFSEVKIDRSFVTDAGSNDAAKLVLSSALDLARQLKLSSVAEGVETQQDWDLLHELGCDIAQGYHLARPMAGDAYSRWVTEVGSDPMTMVKRRRLCRT